MVVAAGLYSSIEAKRIDTWYSLLIDNQIKSVYNINAARSSVMRYGLFLYGLIVETDPARMQMLNTQLGHLHRVPSSHRGGRAAVPRILAAGGCGRCRV